MIHHIVQFALRQRFLVLMFVACCGHRGRSSFQHMPVDAYPDLSLPWSKLSRSGPAMPPRKSSAWLRLPIESR